MKLFCLPYAGGSETIFYPWKSILNVYGIQVIPIELKGRGKRLFEEKYADLNEAVNDIYEHIKDELNEDYAIFGHSMGCILAYELYYKILSSGKKPPIHIFFSGHRVPSEMKDRVVLHKLPDHEFINKVFELGGTHKEILEVKELLDIVIPILRGDFKILETYTYKKHDEKIQCGVSVFNGKYDSITNEDMLKWHTLCEKNINFYVFNGNHFFINDKFMDVISAINHTIQRRCR